MATGSSKAGSSKGAAGKPEATPFESDAATSRIIGQAAASMRAISGVATQLAGQAASSAAEQVTTLVALLPTVISQLNTVEDRVALLGERLDQLDARLASLDDRLDALNAQTSGLRSDLNKTRRTIDRVHELERQRDAVVATLSDVAVDLPKRTRRALLGIVGLGQTEQQDPAQQ